jgi:hypothetical protein
MEIPSGAAFWEANPSGDTPGRACNGAFDSELDLEPATYGARWRSKY